MFSLSVWLTILIIGAAPIAEAKHTISAFNCFSASKISKFKTKSMCEERKEESPVLRSYDIVQRVYTRKLTGHRCSEVGSPPCVVSGDI